MPLALPFKINVPKTETTVNLKSASFVAIMLLHEGLTHIQSQIKPQLLFWYNVKDLLATSNDVADCDQLDTTPPIFLYSGSLKHRKKNINEPHHTAQYSGVPPQRCCFQEGVRRYRPL